MSRVNWQDPLGAGISLWKDCSHNIKSSSGIQKVYEAIYGRLTDKLFYNSNYGIPVAKRIRSSNPLTWSMLEDEIVVELLKDDRLASVEVNIDYDEPNKIVNIYIYGSTVTGDNFNLVGDVNLLTTENIQFNL